MYDTVKSNLILLICLNELITSMVYIRRDEIYVSRLIPPSNTTADNKSKKIHHIWTFHTRSRSRKDH